MLDESGEIHGDLEAMTERIEYLASVYCTEGMSQQVLELGRRTEELQQVIKVRLPSLQDAAKVLESSFSDADSLSNVYIMFLCLLAMQSICGL